MSLNNDKLRKRVFEFIKVQPGYMHEEREKILSFFKNGTFTVIYGNRGMAGIIGIGKNIDLAFTDFVSSWEKLNGFEWLKKNK